MVRVIPAKRTEVTSIKCPRCNWVLPRAKLKQGSVVSGLTFKCDVCKQLFEVEAK